MRVISTITPFLLLAAVLQPVLHGQGTSAALTGLITDSSQAVIQGAAVKVNNLSTNVSRGTTTDTAGYYNFPSLAVGEYEVTVEHPGFASAKQRLQIDTAEHARQDFTLAVAGAAQEVTVNATAAELSPDDASLATTIAAATVTSTPLYLRQWDDLIRLVPGVQANPYTDQNGATSAGRTGGFNVHGIHSLQNNFMLDGIDDNSISENVQELTSEVVHPSVDTIQEFRVITNPYSAEFGRSPGATVTVTTKSGANDIHGLLLEYLRNRVFDANDFFSNKNGLVKPQNEQNQFGGNVGGPIRKNKLFWFFDYEGTRIQRGVSRTATVPLPNERAGDFSPETGAAVGVKYPTIYDFTTGQPFADNRVPASRLDPYGVKLLNLFPLPNIPGTAGDLNNFIRNAGLTDNADAYDGRLDWNQSEKDLIFFRYAYSTRFRFIPGNFGGIADGTTTSAFGRQTLTANSGVLGWTHTVTPTITNEFRLGYNRNLSYAQQDPFGLNHADQFVPGVPENPAIDGGVSQTSFANYTNIGSPDFLPKRQIPQQFQWIDNVSLSLGRHLLKFGVDIQGPVRNIFQDEPGTRGSLGFDKIFTCQRGANGQCTGNTGISYADALLGYVKSAQLTNVFFVDQRLKMLGGFAQDDWRITPKLTLNLGMRYDFSAPAVDGQNRMANFNPAGNGGAGSLVYASSGSLQNRALVQPNSTDFGPRIGFAWSLDKKTVLRGGYGIFYTLFERVGSENQLALNPPNLVNNTPSVPSNATAPVFFLQNGFPANFLDPNSLNLKLVHLRAENPYFPTPMVQQWSFGVQQELSGGIVAEVDYVGTKSTHLDVLSDLNQPVNAAGTGVTAALPYPNFGYIEYSSAIANGIYNGLEASLVRRLHAGLELRATYTYSRSIDNVSQELEAGSGNAQNGLNYHAWRGPSDFDVPQRLTFYYIYELPAGRGHQMFSHGLASYVFGNWKTSGFYSFAAGRPVTVSAGSSLGSSIDAYGAATAVPNVIGTPHIVGDPNCWYYASINPFCRALDPNLTDAFQLQQPGQFGNAGRNVIRGPHISTFSFNLLKDFPIRERVSMQFRWEVFNLTNTPIFAQPSNNFSSGSAGQITTLAGDPRVMQFALRLSF